ncbi:MAG: hypothetical protein E6Q97_01470 [Desulfurellales bacterium]|nr:MAG: hypothetical protein E6Q97_01470 [Desulfurellales bacterium]
MFELAQQITYYLSIVDGGASSRLVSMGQQLASVAMIANTVQNTFNSMVAPLQQIGTAWGRREQEINNITRTLRQYQYVGQSVAEINKEIAQSMPGATAEQRGAAFTQRYNQQFSAGREVAVGAIAQMAQLAATLPGELQDYSLALSQNLPYFAQAGMSLGASINVMSRLQAGAIASGIDPAQAARDMTQFMTMGPHLMDRSWSEVWRNFARDRRTGAPLSAERIRTMSMGDRAKVLADIAAQLGPLMDATGDSYEALMGTLRSLQSEFKLTATEPIFNAWKGTINAVNLVLAEHGPKFARIGRFISDSIVPAMTSMNKHIVSLNVLYYLYAARLSTFMSRVTFVGAQLHSVYSSFSGRAGGAARRVYNAVDGFLDDHGYDTAWKRVLSVLPMVAIRAFGLALGPVGYLLTSGLIRLITGNPMGARQVGTDMLGAMAPLVPQLFQIASALYRLWDGLVQLSATVLQIVLPMLSMMVSVLLQTVFTGLTPFFNVVVNLSTMAFAALAAALVFVAELVTEGFRVLFYILRAFGVQAMGTVATTADMIDSLKAFAWAIGEFITDIRSAVNGLLHYLHLMTDEEYTAAQRTLDINTDAVGQQNKWMASLAKALNPITSALDPNLRGQAPTNRPRVHQDFRYSRFDITQKFAEGFDPDRIASAFASDLEAMASQRLQSGFTPVGSVG